MAPNGTSRKTPAKPTENQKRSTFKLESSFDELQDKRNLKITAEDAKAEVPTKKPSGWDSDIINSSRTSPKLSHVPITLAKAFPSARPIHDNPLLLKCTHCKRAVSKHAMPRHVEICLSKKQEKQRKKKEAKDARDAAARKEQREGSADSENDNANTAADIPGVSKKRKAIADNEEDEPAAKKKKKLGPDTKAKPARPKAPVDVEKQCGVELPQGGQCARSLTCKSHSMGAKRAVPGRSAPYDKLLMEYQRKNQAKLQKAQFEAVGNADVETEGPVDSGEERDSVMAAIGRAWGGTPLVRQAFVPLKQKYRYQRIRSMLQGALGGRGGSGGLFSGGGGIGFFGSSDAVVPPAANEAGPSHVRRGSMVPAARGMVAARKGSIAT